MKKTLVVGAGFTGAVIAERIASQLGERVVLIDKRDHIAGNAYDCFDQHDVMVHRYGPHIFHTNASRIVEYLSHFTEWRPYEHKVLGLVNDAWIPLPFNLTSIENLFGETEGKRLNSILLEEYGSEVKIPILNMRKSSSSDVRNIADVIYEKVFYHYTVKQWGVEPEDLDPSVSARVPIHLSRDDRYFQDRFQAMPTAGYTAMFQNILSHPLIEQRCGLSFQDLDGTESFDRVVFTGPIDEFFDYAHGALPYRSIRFEMRNTRSPDPLQRAATENYPTPAAQHAFTRSTEFRLLTGQSGIESSTQAFEYPETYQPGKNEPYYPIPREQNQVIFRKYATDAKKLRTVHFAGRLADYSYYNMDQAVGRALTCFEKNIA